MKKLAILFMVSGVLLSACGFDAETTTHMTKAKNMVANPVITPPTDIFPSGLQKLHCENRKETTADYQTCGDRCAAQNNGDRNYVLCEYGWNQYTQECELRVSCGSLEDPLGKAKKED